MTVLLKINTSNLFSGRLEILCVIILIWDDDVLDHGATGGRMDLESDLRGSVSATAIDSSNKGFQVLSLYLSLTHCHVYHMKS